MSLRNPAKKMSKSDPSEQGTLWLTDPPDQIRKKIKKAVTDSIPDTMTHELWNELSSSSDERQIQGIHGPFFSISEDHKSKERLGLQNLWSISAACLNLSLPQAYAKFCREYGPNEEQCRSVSKLKEFTANTVIETLNPIQKRYDDLLNDDDITINVLSRGAELARTVAAETMEQVRQEIGLLRL